MDELETPQLGEVFEIPQGVTAIAGTAAQSAFSALAVLSFLSFALAITRIAVTAFSSGTTFTILVPLTLASFFKRLAGLPQLLAESVCDLWI